MIGRNDPNRFNIGEIMNSKLAIGFGDLKRNEPE